MEPEKDDVVTIKMSDLKNIVGECVKTMDIPQLKDLKEQILAINRKAIFPDGEGSEFETISKSVVDFGWSQKKLGSSGLRMGQLDGKALVDSIRGFGGPWVKLSPTMEKFAKVLAARGDYNKCRAANIDLDEYNKEVMDMNAKVTPLTRTDLGVAVPVEYLATIVEFAVQDSKILPKLWRIPMTTQTMKVPKLAQTAGSYFGGITLYHPDEGVEKTDTKPSFDYLSFEAKKMIGLISLTDEAIADASIGLINYITALFIRAFRYKIEGEVVSGTGLLNQMLGILSDPSINLVARTTSGTVKYKDLLNLESAIDENFDELTWLSRRATVNVLRAEQDTVGQPVYHDGITTFLGGSMPAQLISYPVIKSRNVPALGSKGDLTLGDLGMFIWALRQDMTIDTSKDWRFPYDETAIRFVMRMDGMPGVSIAFAALKAATS